MKAAVVDPQKSTLAFGLSRYASQQAVICYDFAMRNDVERAKAAHKIRPILRVIVLVPISWHKSSALHCVASDQ
ncbi:MAG: hypothetical protein IPG54_13825 [Sphingomonadales bacterium]|nr:hypothetical protein [Sphingomonadales bacterium]